MQTVRSSCRQALTVLLLCLVSAISMPAAALNLFSAHEVTITMESADGKALADAEIRIFAPGRPNQPAMTGRTDSSGKYTFTADQDGFWSAEGRRGDEIVRVSIKVGGNETTTERISPFLLIGLLVLMLGIVIWYRVLRARNRRRMS